MLPVLVPSIMKVRYFLSFAWIAHYGASRSEAPHNCIPMVYIYITSNKNFILKYFRCRDGKRTETRIGMEGICITHSCIPLYTVYMQHIMAHSGGMQEWVIQIPSIPILVSVLFPSLHLRIKFLLLVCIVFMRMCTKPHPHPVIS